jgi:predicted nucleotide-binding protein
MSDLLGDLKDLQTRARRLCHECNTPQIKEAITGLLAVANELESAHSGSWLGYHALVYYRNLQSPPSGAYFDRRWKLQDRYSSATSGDWLQYGYSDVYDLLRRTPTHPTFDELIDLSSSLAEELDDLREDLILVIEACRAGATDPYLDRLRDEAQKALMTSPQQFVRASVPPPPPMTNDTTAVAGGTMVPPHANFKALLFSARSLFDSAADLEKIAGRIATYISRKREAASMLKTNQCGTRVFIGHGRSSAWLELKNYIQDRLGLQCDDFNRESTAGHTTVSRLSRMLDDACFAFLVLTAEDVQTDGRTHARLNVVHEAGLFQGRIGFEKAIIVLEDGCEEFSNIHGLGQIRFDKGKISGSFHEVHDTLRREGIIER